VCERPCRTVELQSHSGTHRGGAMKFITRHSIDPPIRVAMRRCASALVAAVVVLGASIAVPVGAANAASLTVSGVKLSLVTLPPQGGPVLVSSIPSQSATCSLVVIPTGPVLPTPAPCGGGQRATLKLFVPSLMKAAPLTFNVAVKACSKGKGGCALSHYIALRQRANKITFTSTGAPWGTPVAASCPSVNFCAVADASSTITIRSGSKYHRVLLQQGRLISSVECASTTLCVAGDVNGDGFTWNGSVWHKGVTISSILKADKVTGACASNRCMLVWTHATVAGLSTPMNVEAVWNGTAWSPPVTFATPGVISAVSCPPTGTACGAVDASGYFTVFGDGLTAASFKANVTGGAFTTLSCPSAHSCAMGGQANMVARSPFAQGKTTTTVNLQIVPARTVQTMSCAVDLSCFVATSTTVYIAIGDLDNNGRLDFVAAGVAPLPSAVGSLVVAVPGVTTQFMVMARGKGKTGHVTLMK